MTTRRSYDRVAARYASELSGELAGKPLDRALLGVVAELADGPVLDVGCGPGHVAAYLADRVPVVGVDLSPQMCAHASVPVCAGDMTALPFRSHSVSALVCLYAVIHLDVAGRAAAYAEFARVLRPGGHALVAFHVRDAETEAGQAKTLTEWWGNEVDLTFRFLDPGVETQALAEAGLTVTARLDRVPDPRAEHPSDRCYLLARAAKASGSGS
ncbi:class I SAM-dependent methyltransferase [Lentzea sp. BCCO 10_0856]|uniref:Class I SAM-dependent methyltransferase n=1 Tax=Lentzea miocenica TaxID=3095431 RepID=A0ABU4TCC2_9PSEU|nr:class I SAM-dependent methyltransferase [Lentzea sp. BCCO 10_0856]MDX8035824.1 class I SAM-dependent methyltransferase [Lentzea sp. BCCO 10_0856]